MKRLWIGVALAVLLSACASREVKDEGAAVEQRTPSPITQAPEPAKPKPPVTQEPVVKPVVTKPIAANPLKDPDNILSKRSVYFDFDSSVVKDEFRPLVTAHSKYLTEHRNRRVVIQGHTDERGSREYNLALGQRRADSVKRMMVLLGVNDGQVETVSFGEEKPRATGSDEAAYAENRRGDIVYDGE